jgi:hypothetical protein
MAPDSQGGSALRNVSISVGVLGMFFTATAMCLWGRPHGLLEFRDADVLENRSEDVSYILHEGRKILLEDTDNEIWTIICGLTGSQFGNNLGPSGIGGEGDE